MTDTLIPNGQLIVFNFPAGAGGKMLQNCVGLSRHCVLNNKEYIRWQLDYAGPVDDAFYQQKLQWILETVPPKEDMHRWLGYEIDKNLPHGFDYTGFRDNRPIPNPDYRLVADQGLWCTITAHNTGVLEYFQNYWPKMKMVCLINNEQFAKKSLVIKNNSLSFDEDWKLYGFRHPTIKIDTFNFDVDNTIYNRDKFLNQVQDLYNYLDFDDFQPALITEYYDKYIAIHS